MQGGFQNDLQRHLHPAPPAPPQLGVYAGKGPSSPRVKGTFSATLADIEFVLIVSIMKIGFMHVTFYDPINKTKHVF